MMFPLKYILVCSDFSPHSDFLLNETNHLNSKLNAQVDILVLNDQKHLTDDEFQEVLKKMNLNFFLIRDKGEVTTSILKHIINGKKRYDLLIIGHNTLSEKRFKLQNVAKKILSDVPIPTLVLTKNFSFKKMACLFDQISPSEWELSASFDFYRSFKYDFLEFISVIPFSKYYGQMTNDNFTTIKDEIYFFSRPEDKYNVSLLSSKPFQTHTKLTEIIKQEGIDLVVMKRNHHKSFFKKLQGSQTLKLLNMDICNILVSPI